MDLPDEEEITSKLTLYKEIINGNISAEMRASLEIKIAELLEDEAALDRIITNTHATIGAEILKKWNFPEELIVVAQEHENLQRNSDNGPDYVDVVTVANLQSLADTDHPHTKVDWSTVPAFEKLGLQSDVSIVDMDETNANIEAARSALTS